MKVLEGDPTAKYLLNVGLPVPKTPSVLRTHLALNAPGSSTETLALIVFFVPVLLTRISCSNLRIDRSPRPNIKESLFDRKKTDSRSNITTIPIV
jgi:hypothetical protein